MMRIISTALAALVLLQTASAMAATEPVKFTQAPTVARADGKTVVSFTLSAKTDVEVAILDAKGKVVRHLAGGVLGKNPPPPLKAGSLSQSIEWDGKDDHAEPARGGPFKARVRAGMGAKLEQIVGGDPYAFFSRQSGEGDHSQWRVSGLEVKSDGSVYVMGNTIFYGAQVIRQYDAAGNYRRTVFPPPAGKRVEDVKGWGINVRADGSYTLRNSNNWQNSALSSTWISANYGKLQVALAPTPERGSLTLLSEPRAHRRCQFIEIGTDGSLKTYQPRPFFGSAQLPPYLRGPCYTALAPDGKHLYVSGLHSCKRKVGYGRAVSVDTTGFWRDGQVWKLDLATRKMSVFFALDEKKVVADMKSRAGAIGDGNYINPCAALHGVAVDAEGRVFVCDRQNRRIVVLDKTGKLIREIPNVAYPDAIGVSPKPKALYVTTRYGLYSGRGKLTLLKFNDWSKDSAPAATVPVIGRIARFPHSSLLTVAEKDGEVMVWVAYTTLPVRVYRDTDAGLELVKDFYQAGPQRALDLQHMQVDQGTGDVYFDDGHAWCFRISDWKDPKFELCVDSATKKRLVAASIAIDARGRYLYAHQGGTSRGMVRRYKMDGARLTPAPVGTSGHKVTTQITCGWGFSGIRERGMAAAPGGGLATLGVVVGKGGRATHYGGPVHFWKPDQAKAPWQPVSFKDLGKGPTTGGIRFDPRGNLYVGVNNHKVKDVPPGYAKDPTYRRVTGRIHKYAPTGSLMDGGLFPTAPPAPAKVYDVHYGPLPRAYHTPRFGVDGYGRIYYPNGVRSRVSVIDNEGNRILSFGTWGNRDSMGGLKGDLVPTRDVPMACPNSVDATDDHIYVADMNNVRLLRLAKKFQLEAAAEIQ